MLEEMGGEDRRRLADEDRWLTVDEVAERLRVDGATVREWVASGRLPAGAGGDSDRPRIRLSELEAFLLEQR